MLQKLELQQLQELSLEDIKSYKEQAEARKEELIAAKAKGGKAWTTALQEELDEIVISLVDIEDVIKEKSEANAPANKPAKVAKSVYTPKPGTENMVHLSIVRGRRFNPLTGQEESPSYAQLFTFAEWQLFKKTYKGLGYTIMAVLHDPYGEAKNFVQK
jgi:hypothetical protein